MAPKIFEFIRADLCVSELLHVEITCAKTFVIPRCLLKHRSANRARCSLQNLNFVLVVKPAYLK